MSLDELKLVESVKVEEYFDGSGEDARQVKAITIKAVTNNVKVKALELIAKHLRMFDEKENEDGATVAVIGAGISGLFAARTLRDHGVSVTVFDKSRGVGGRMSTRRTDQGTTFCLLYTSPSPRD